MGAAFNLIKEPWLPVRRRSGIVESIPPWRITDNISSDPCVAFAWPRPDFNGAAHEFVIGLLATTAAPDDDDAWEEWWHEPPSPQELEQRFLDVAHAFDLDGPGPRFLQDADPLEDADDKEIAALLIDTPGAQTIRNNADLFVKRGGVPVLSRGAAAMALFTLNSYAPSGGAGHRTSLRGGGPLTTLIVADHAQHRGALWCRIWPNVESGEQIASRASDAVQGGDSCSIFPWCGPTRTSNPKAGGRPTTPVDVHPLQVYWGMPRRIRLRFEDAAQRRCGVTGSRDTDVAVGFRARNYGTNYSGGFEHPLTPYYRQKATAVEKLPVHPNPGGVSYRMWPGLVIASGDGLREPASVIRQWRGERRGTGGARVSRFVAFGYDMDNMKARAWSEAEMPLWQLYGGTQEFVDVFIRHAVAGADTVTRLLMQGVKSALHDNPKAAGDYGFVAERFYRETEGSFYSALEEATRSSATHPEDDDPTTNARRHWAPIMEKAALRLFDEYAPAEGLEDRDMHRHVRARFFLARSLGGRGKDGRSLFEGDLQIPAPESARSSRSRQESP